MRAEAIVDNVQVLVEVDDTDSTMAERLALEFARVFEEQHAARNQGIPVGENGSIHAGPSDVCSSGLAANSSHCTGGHRLGIAFGALLALLLAYVNDTIKSAADVTRRLNLATLASIPAPPTLSHGSHGTPSRARSQLKGARPDAVIWSQGTDRR